MALTTPILNAITPFPSDEANIFTFQVIGGATQVAQNRLEIQQTSDNTSVYNQVVSSFAFTHTLPANTLTNGTEYKARVQTLNSDGTIMSTFSEFVVFNVIDRPVVTITTIVNETVNAQTVTFTGSYTQTHDTLQSYRYILYDANQNIIQSFSEKFDGLLQQEITELENGVTYFLELKTVSTLGMEGTSGLRRFVPTYVPPILPTIITLENLVDQGAIRVTGSLTQLVFQLTDGSSPVYIDNELLDITDKTITLSGLSVGEDFTFKIWARNITEDNFRFRLYTGLSFFQVTYENNRFYLRKFINNQNIYYLITTDEITFTASDVVGITIQQIDEFCNILASIEP